MAEVTLCPFLGAGLKKWTVSNFSFLRCLLLEPRHHAARELNLPPRKAHVERNQQLAMCDSHRRGRSSSPSRVSPADVTWSGRAVPAELCPNCRFMRKLNDSCYFKLLTIEVTCSSWIIATLYIVGDRKEKCQVSYMIGDALLFQVYIT